MITVTKKVHFTRGRSGRKRIVDAPPKPQPEYAGRVPRVSRVMALAIHFDKLLQSGVVCDTIELARLTKVTQPRITQVLNMLHLAPDIQEALLSLPHVTEGRDRVNEKQLRKVCAHVSFKLQRQLWAAIQPRVLPAPS